METQRLTWAGGEHDFALPLARLRALQEACDAGPEEIFIRLRTGRWRVNDLFETLRQGLIGGGMKDGEAGPMVTLLFEQHPLATFKMTVATVLGHALLGPEDDRVGKPQREEGSRENGASPGSSETGLSWASRRGKSEK